MEQKESGCNVMGLGMKRSIDWRASGTLTQVDTMRERDDSHNIGVCG